MDPSKALLDRLYLGRRFRAFGLLDRLMILVKRCLGSLVRQLYGSECSPFRRTIIVVYRNLKAQAGKSVECPVPSPVTVLRHVVPWLIRSAPALPAHRAPAVVGRPLPTCALPRCSPAVRKMDRPIHITPAPPPLPPPSPSPRPQSSLPAAGRFTPRARATPPRARGASRRIGTGATHATPWTRRRCGLAPKSPS